MTCQTKRRRVDASMGPYSVGYLVDCQTELARESHMLRLINFKFVEEYIAFLEETVRDNQAARWLWMPLPPLLTWRTPHRLLLDRQILAVGVGVGEMQQLDGRIFQALRTAPYLKRVTFQDLVVDWKQFQHVLDASMGPHFEWRYFGEKLWLVFNCLPTGTKVSEKERRAAQQWPYLKLTNFFGFPEREDIALLKAMTHNNRTLKWLWVSFHSPGEKDRLDGTFAEALGTAPNLTHVTVDGLHLPSSPLVPNICKEVFQPFLYCKTLIYLHLTRSNIGDSHIPQLTYILDKGNLKELGLAQTNATGSTVAKIVYGGGDGWQARVSCCVSGSFSDYALPVGHKSRYRQSLPSKESWHRDPRESGLVLHVIEPAATVCESEKTLRRTVWITLDSQCAKDAYQVIENEYSAEGCHEINSLCSVG